MSSKTGGFLIPNVSFMAKRFLFALQKLETRKNWSFPSKQLAGKYDTGGGGVASSLEKLSVRGTMTFGYGTDSIPKPANNSCFEIGGLMIFTLTYSGVR